MALSALSGDELNSIFIRLCNPLEPRVAVAFSIASHGLQVSTQVARQQLRTQHEAAAYLCHKAGKSHFNESPMGTCEQLRMAKSAFWVDLSLSAADFTTLAMLSSVLPALEELSIIENLPAAAAISGPDSVQQLVTGLCAGALPAVTVLRLDNMYVGNAGASALADALGRGALPQLTRLFLDTNGIGDAGLLALAPALRRLPALNQLFIGHNLIGDEGLAALVAPSPPPTGALSPPTRVLTKLAELTLSYTQISDAGCAALASAFDRGDLPECKVLNLDGISATASATARVAVREALQRRGGIIRGVWMVV